MYLDLFDEFLTSGDTLRIFQGDKLIFTSQKDRLLPLMEYITGPCYLQEQVTIFDKITGNAAALLAVRAKGREVYSPMGSELAIKTLDKFGVRYHFTDIVPYIQQPDGKSMCPMEQLSIGREPEEFYEIMQARLAVQSGKEAAGKETTWKR